VIEAVIGALLLCAGFERTSAAVVEAFAEQIEDALDHLWTSKSALQERLARHGETVVYEVTEQHGPPHDRTFTVAAIVADTLLAHGSGRSKKMPNRTPRATALRSSARRARTPRRCEVSARCTEVDHHQGLQVLPERTRLEFGAGVSVIRRPQRVGASRTSPTRCSGHSRTVAAGGSRPVDAGT